MKSLWMVSFVPPALLGLTTLPPAFAQEDRSKELRDSPFGR